MNRKEAKQRTAGKSFAVFASSQAPMTKAQEQTMNLVKGEHGANAFQEPAIAMERARKQGRDTWKVSKKHRANQKVEECGVA